jgi:hypothetical protein
MYLTCSVVVVEVATSKQQEDATTENEDDESDALSLNEMLQYLVQLRQQQQQHHHASAVKRDHGGYSDVIMTSHNTVAQDSVMSLYSLVLKSQTTPLCVYIVLAVCLFVYLPTKFALVYPVAIATASQYFCR